MWKRIKRFFKDSETIFWARLQTALGIVAAALTYVDPSLLQPIIPAQYFPWLLVANGIITEYLRRRREDGL
ncbi:hypothetical protein [Mesorhizobium sp. 1M-11]|uniref:hypothetical protein n=1 Tax=Mesorhizobium sp. 1M-11 TaxID=1529006 RepID=UPI0006C765A7|nr:hypothetical protein [Mesorhizobium sp. 1M-11]